jgi:nucleoside-diphosphate-sugar epimerase
MTTPEAPLAGQTVFVTGGTGFVGNALVRRLAGAAAEVRVLALPDDPQADAIQSLGGSVRVLTGDVCRPETLTSALRGADLAFHCAAVVTDWAPRPVYNKVNVEGTENVLAAAMEAGVRRLLHVSTNDVFGLGEDRVMDETFPLSPWGEPYPDTKIAAERACWRAHGSGRVEVSMVYPCWVYGPGDSTFVPELAEAIEEGTMVLWRPDCLVWPNYVENLVDLMLLAATRPEGAGQGYLAHDGFSLTLDDFCHRIAERLGTPPPTRVLPRWAAMTAARAMEGTGRFLRRTSRPLLTTYIVKNLGARLQFSIDKARRELGWEPQVGFEEGFAAAMDALGST